MVAQKFPAPKGGVVEGMAYDAHELNYNKVLSSSGSVLVQMVHELFPLDLPVIVPASVKPVTSRNTGPSFALSSFGDESGGDPVVQFRGIGQKRPLEPDTQTPGVIGEQKRFQHTRHLRNVLQWIRKSYDSVLTPLDKRIFDSFDTLSVEAVTLISRLYSRKGPLFTLADLQRRYSSELGDTEAVGRAILELYNKGWINAIFGEDLQLVDGTAHEQQQLQDRMSDLLAWIYQVHPLTPTQIALRSQMAAYIDPSANFPVHGDGNVDFRGLTLPEQLQFLFSFVCSHLLTVREAHSCLTVTPESQAAFAELQRKAADSRSAITRADYVSCLRQGLRAQPRPLGAALWQSWGNVVLCLSPLHQMLILRCDVIVGAVSDGRRLESDSGMHKQTMEDIHRVVFADKLVEMLPDLKGGLVLNQGQWHHFVNALLLERSWEEALSHPDFQKHSSSKVKFASIVVDTCQSIIASYLEPQAFDRDLPFDQADSVLRSQTDRFRRWLLDVGKIAQVENVSGTGLHAFATSRPQFLWRFTAPWVAARIMTHCLTVLEGDGEHFRCAVAYRGLLRSPFCPTRRGHWWIRLSLCLQHLKSKPASLTVAEEALTDVGLRLSDRLALESRVRKMSKEPLRWKLHPSCPPNAPAALPEDSMDAKRIALVDGTGKGGAQPARRVLYQHEGRAVTVEELVLHKYCTPASGWLGIHCEGSLLCSIFGLLCWDLIFMDVEGVFQTRFQSHPLDMFTDSFYNSRAREMEARFSVLAKMKSQELYEEMEKCWEAHEGVACHGLKWDLFPNRQTWADICHCLQPKGLVELLRAMAMDYSGHCAGFPDLFLWHPKKSMSLFLEVKSTNDKLSDRQKEWIYILQRAKQQVVVLRVKDIQ